MFAKYRLSGTSNGTKGRDLCERRMAADLRYAEHYLTFSFLKYAIRDSAVDCAKKSMPHFV
jgi:hypothetical protein